MKKLSVRFDSLLNPIRIYQRTSIRLQFLLFDFLFHAFSPFCHSCIQRVDDKMLMCRCLVVVGSAHFIYVKDQLEYDYYNAVQAADLSKYVVFDIQHISNLSF